MSKKIKTQLQKDIEEIGGKVIEIIEETEQWTMIEFEYKKKEWWIAKETEDETHCADGYVIQTKEDGMAGEAAMDWMPPNSKSLKDYLDSFFRFWI